MALSRSSKGFLVVLLLLGVAVGGGLAWLGTGGGGETSAVAEGETIVVEIPEGSGAATVADLLEERGVIRSAFAFRLFARFDDRAGQIRPGEYELVAGMSSDEIFDVITQGPEPAETFRVTIPEGLTVDQTIRRLAEASPHSEEALHEALSAVAVPDWVPVADLPEEAQPYEGLLFPDTYEFIVDTDPQEILSALIAQTDAVLAEVSPVEGFDRYDTLIVASLIEREARLREEQPVVASVIYNRLARPMRLQIDATVQYARGEHTERLLFEDLDIQSLWNTYQTDGLPPTPIAAAGRSAIQAAADPDDTDYFFYVVNDLETGSHAFAETQAEHERNVAEFRRMRAEAEAEAEGDDG